MISKFAKKQGNSKSKIPFSFAFFSRNFQYLSDKKKHLKNPPKKKKTSWAWKTVAKV